MSDADELDFDDAQITRALVEREGLHEFIRCFWTLADPGSEFVDSWYIGAIAEHCEAVSCREIKRLVISMPPRMGKSTIVSVLWPAWHWTFQPEHRWLIASYDDSLVQRDARKTIELVNAPEYANAWPGLGVGAKAKVKMLRNAHGGFRKSTTIGGATTGAGSNTQICDDPIKADQRRSSKALERAWTWWNETMSSRIDGLPKDFARVMIMQRLAENDPAGQCLRSGGYEHLCLPMRYVPNASWDMGSSLPPKDPRTEPGEILTERYDEESLVRLEKELGSPAAVSAQMQQNPIPDKGGIIERDWLGKTWSWEQLGDLNRLRWVQSWDFGFKGEDSGHSRVHGALWAMKGQDVFLIAEINPVHINYPESKKLFQRMQLVPLWARARMKLVEDKANGIAILAELKEAVRGMHPVEPKGSKEERLIRHSDAVQAGVVWMPPKDACPTADDFKHEIVAFPAGEYDDRVDTTTQALDHFLGSGSRIRGALKQYAERMKSSPGYRRTFMV